ncbi:MAG TPA: pitrilysin family protein [Phycisphaerae bacterium]|nr:pitrilysin family protein [Phycisphaerae bacterium]
MSNHRHRFWIFAVTLGFVFCNAVTLSAEPAAPRKITSVEGITEYQLENGMKVLLFPDASKPTVTVNITYFVGSRHEGYGETGMAHLLEHMVFKGTPDHPKVWKHLQDHGAQFNGTTSYDRTNYFETMAASDENLEFGLSLEADRMVNSFIAKKDLDSEFSVVRNEFEMGENNPMSIMSERIWSTAYLWHNYGKSTIGSREDIERVPIARLQAFYHKYYQPDNAMLVVAGKFDPEKALKRINELFGSIPKPSRELEKTYTVEPPQDGEREVTLRRMGEIQAIGCAYHICSAAHDDAAPIDVLADILDTTQTGRLYKALVEPELAVNVRANSESLFDPGLFEVVAEVRMDKSLPEVRKIMFDVLDNIANQDISDKEVERSKNAHAKNFNQLMSDSGRVGIRLTEFASKGDWRLLFHQRDQMEKVTPSDVKRVAALYLRPSNRTVGTFIPTKDPLRTKVPESPDAVAMMKDYTGKDAMAEGESLGADPATIESKTQRVNLPCGIKLAMLPKKTRGDKVHVSMTFHFGAEKDFKDRLEAAGFVDEMLSRGTSKHTRRELTDAFDQLKATAFIGAGGGGGRGGRMMTGGGGGLPGSLSVTIDTPRENLAKVMELVGEELRDSIFPEKEFTKLIKQRLAMAEQMRSEPTALALMEMRRHMSPYPKDDIRYVPTVEEAIERLKSVKLEDIKAVYKELMGASNGEIAAVGDFEPAEFQKLVTDTFKDWKSNKPYERIAMPYKENKTDSMVINTPDKANSLITLGMNVPIRDDDADYPALSMANFMLGGNANSRLLNRIRQKDGLSYTVRSMMMASSLDKSGAFTTMAICNPQNAEKAMAAAREEIDKALQSGFTDKELEDAKNGYFEQMKVQMSNEQALAGMLARDLYLGRTMKFRGDELDKIKALNVDDVNKTIKKYIHPDRLMAVRAGDFEKINEEKGEPGKQARKKHAEESSEKSSS